MMPLTQKQIRAMLQSPRWYGTRHPEVPQPPTMALTEDDWTRATNAWGKYCGNSTADVHRVICRRLREGKSASGWYPPKTMTGCAIDGCERDVYARGMCHTHYERSRIGLDVTAPIIPRKRAA